MTLNSGQQKYCMTCKELLIVFVFSHHHHHYLLYRQFAVWKDHENLAWLMQFKQSDGLLHDGCCSWDSMTSLLYIISGRNILMLMVCHKMCQKGSVSAIWQGRMWLPCPVEDVISVQGCRIWGWCKWHIAIAIWNVCFREAVCWGSGPRGNCPGWWWWWWWWWW